MRIEALRALGSADRAPLLDLWVESWTAAIPTIDFAARRGWFEPYLDTLMARGALLLLLRPDEGGAPCGFATLDPATGEVDQLAVARADQGRGHARALLEEAKRRSPAGLRLRVVQVNGRAVELYRRAGFVVTGETVSARSGLEVWEMAWRP